MASKHLRRVGLLVAAAALAGVLTAVASGKPAAPAQPANINADFESYVNFNGNDFCPLSTGAVLVEGRGTATGPFGKFDSAIGTAEECSAPAGGPPPQLGTCDNIQPGHSFFDVHGQGVYVTKDGSVLALTYHELSENPFELIFPPGPGLGNFSLHDCGIWQVDAANSTGIFAGATGHGQISATVPIRSDFSAHVFAAYTPDAHGALTLAGGAKGPAGSPETHCFGTLTGPVTGNVTVDEGAFCDLDVATVNGDVHVRKGATVVMQSSIARGNLECNGCASLTVYPATVLGDLHADHAGATTIISSKVGGDLDVHNGGGAVILTNYAIGHDLRVHGNAGFSQVAGNTAAHAVDCHGNTPDPLLSFTVPFPPSFGLTPPTFTGNDAPDLKGQCSLFGLGPQGPSGP